MTRNRLPAIERRIRTVKFTHTRADAMLTELCNAVALTGSLIAAMLWAGCRRKD